MHPLTPGDINRFVTENELPIRQKLMGERAERVLRRGAFVGSDLHQFDSLPRAMNHARSLVDQAARSGSSFVNGTTILSQTLTGSKGRFARSWYAPEGGLWGCLAHVNSLLPQTRLFIPIAVGVACCEAIHQQGVDTATIRWVNDVLLHDQKIAGFLVESYGEPLSGEAIDLIGFGINVNNSSFPEELDGIATSMANISGHQHDLRTFTLTFLAKLTWTFGLLYDEELHFLHNDVYTNGLEEHPLLTRWKELSDTIGKRVIYGYDVIEKPQYQATIRGLDQTGGLLMELDDGSTITQHSGEVRYISS